MNQYELLIDEAERVVKELRESKNSRIAFLVRTLACSLKKESELRISYEKDIIEQRDYLEKLNKEYISITGKLPEVE